MLVVALVLLGAAAAAAWYFMRIDRSHGPPQPVYVEIPRGSSSWQIGQRLTDAGLVRHPAQYLLARLARPGAGALAGEYEFRPGMTAQEIHRKLARGDIFQVELRVPEGSDVFDLAALVAEAGFATQQEFLRAARSPALAAELVPGAVSLEGFLFPSTYRFPRRTNAERICRTLVRQFQKEWAAAGGQGDPRRAITLASLVEKEARLPAERPRIAGVFANRLAQGMKLECDPTVVYAALLQGRWRGVIYRSDLANPHPYNTYQHAGLPPGPIANPGRASIEAALRPAATDALFFVAAPGGSGAHVFSRDLKSHEKAVAEYRRGEQKARTENQSAGVDRGGRPAAR
jgi:UPF0755 protein